MQEQISQSTKEKAQEIARRFGVEVMDDLRDKSNDEVFRFFGALVDTGLVVLHGTNAEERFDKLEARQAKDTTKKSGNKKAVYAQDGITIPLGLAILNRKYLKSKLKDASAGWTSVKEKTTFEFSPNIYELYKSGDPNFFTDGYVYVLDKANFINAPDAGPEWHSEVDQDPVLAYRVSKRLAEDIFRPDSVREYGPEELQK
ncbi:MAG: hypothetical protein A3J46_04585 [Candidatus Yanofskybacteria bacterium RIFCSPHIGHO2_02_FULL_41_11]|uniref:Uncharacterized protein n=1 Tax=Candidatus Yanofskybacteria bacterium RIFCSPHIGHO2_02_FULL_41_11 TaxID=1802675 RepID=A0A1F8FAH5_9BACT|nr:MAG: hypothetical protein A3J46_04585 [Candidatus Yanofskybacteria bacterium RIFCSPHIGHO2_02_FULL_41_11]